jgi:hypothetical protein
VLVTHAKPNYPTVLTVMLQTESSNYIGGKNMVRPYLGYVFSKNGQWHFSFSLYKSILYILQKSYLERQIKAI